MDRTAALPVRMRSKLRVFLTGSHTVLALLETGYRVTIIDNFDNAFEECYARMQKLAGDNAKNMKLIKVRTMLA